MGDVNRPNMTKTFLFAQQIRQRTCVVKMYKKPPDEHETRLVLPVGESKFLSLHRARREALDEVPLQEDEDDRDRDGRNNTCRHHIAPVRRRLAEERHHKNGARIEQVWGHFMGGFLTRTAFAGKVET